MSPTRPGVVFDLDGTLVDSEPYWIQGFSTGLARILEERGHGHHELDPAQMAAFQGGRVPDTIGTILDWLHLTPSLGAGETAAIVDAVIDEVTRAFVAHPAPIPEVVATARELHQDGYPLAVASSSALSFIDAVVRALDLVDVFPVRVSAVGLPQGKPDPLVYRLALDQLGLGPDRALAIEDSLRGVAAAVNATMRCVWFLPEHVTNPTAGAVDDLLAQVAAEVAVPSAAVRLVSTARQMSRELLTPILDELAMGASR